MATLGIRRLGLTVLSLVLFASGCSRQPTSEDSSQGRPNVILISVDTLRADHLSSYGYKSSSTPNIDRLASEGVLFEQAITAAPLTLPAHTSLLTGTLPVFHGVHDNGGFLIPDNQTTLAQVLRSSGYKTGAFVGSFILDGRFGLNLGFDYYYDNFQTDTLDTVNLQISERRAEEVFAEAERWIGRSSQPFFTFIHLFDPHAPYDAPASFQWPDLAPYDAEVAYVDEEFGKFGAFLRERGLYDNALVILTADHGEGLGEHGENTHGMFLYDSTLHIPLVVKLPGGQPRARRVSDQVRLIDVMPTVLDVLKVQAPAGVQGTSVAKAWTGGRLPELAAYSETQLPFLNYGWSNIDSYRAKGEKLIDAPRPELYDVRSDPGETHNRLPADQARAAYLREIKVRMAGQLLRPESRASGQQGPIDSETVAKLRSLGYLVGGSRRMPHVGPTPGLADPKDKVGLFNEIWRAQAESQQRRFAESIRLLNEVLRRDPSIFIAHSVQAINYLQTQRPAEALPHLKATVRLRPEDPGSHFYLAMASLQLNRLDQAVREFEVTLTLDPKNEAASNNLATLYLRNKNFGKAEGILAGIVRRHPEDVAALANLGLAQMLQNRTDQALNTFQQALQLNPNIPELHNNLGLVLMRTGKYDQAALEFQRALELRPDYQNARANLAEAYQKKGAGR